jgi:hypothetical protein
MSIPAVPTGYTRASTYPRGSKIDGADVVVDRVYIAAASFSMAALYGLTLEIGAKVLKSTNVTWEQDECGHKIYATLTYSESSDRGGSLPDGDTEWTLDDSGQEIPIDKRKNDGSLWFPAYRTNHNHMLAGLAGTEVPAAWSTATNTQLDNELLRWVKYADGLPEGWVILRDKTRNIEAVLRPSPVVVGKKRYSSYSTASAQAVKTGSRVAPASTFGITGEWLVTSSSIYHDGRRWVVETRYQAALQWDADYYPAG